MNAVPFVSSHGFQHRGKLAEDFRVLLELREKLLEIDRRALRLRLCLFHDFPLNLSHIGIGVEGRFKPLRVDSSVLVENMPALFT